MDSISYEEIKGKIIGGVFALSTRTLLLQIISFIATFILTILLSPSVFGIFYVVTAVISFISYFSDIGLAASLIQKKGELSREELVSSFTIQQILIGFIVILSFMLSPFFTSFYNLGNDGVFLYKALLVSFFLSSLKTIPSVLLERKLEFAKLVIPQLLETSIFYIVTIALAFYGFGITSFAWGAIARGIIGLIAIYIVSPWKIGLGINICVSKRLLKFGMPFQINSILALVKDDLMTIFLGKMLPFTQVGYLGWAKKWAEAPLRLIMDSIIRVTFPAFSRLQENKEMLGKAIFKSFFFLSLFIFPSSLMLVLFIKPMIHIIPKYIKWEQALLPFYLYVFSSVMAALSSPVVNAINALGKIKVTLCLMIFWTCLTWVLTPLLVIYMGYNGVAVTSFIIAFTSIIPIIIIKKTVNVSVLGAIRKPLIATCVMTFFAYLLLNISYNIIMLIGTLILSILIYLILVWIFMQHDILPVIPASLQKKILKWKSGKIIL
jgi:O-antigen/teichoic acid export membrane protein